MLAVRVVDAANCAETIEAWRVWRVGMHDGRVILESLLPRGATVWEPGVPLAAVCVSALRRQRGRHEAPHAAPHVGCGCGIYGLRDLVAARSYLETRNLAWRDDRVIGRVALWGEVVEGPSGWRSSRAYPLELYVPAPAVVRCGYRRRAQVERIAEALEAYGVPVDLVAPGTLAAAA